MARNTGAKAAARRDRLARRRKALGLTQEDLAGLLNVERSTVARWECGDSEPLPWIRPKLARALKVPVDRLEELLAVTRQAGSGGAALSVPRQLPAAVANFTGRAAELAALTRMLGNGGPGEPGTVMISAIGGTAGVGKTALAVHWAHQATQQFPDGQLYVNLRGYDSVQPMLSADVLAAFLRSLGVPGQEIPPEADERAARYRSLLAGKRMLVILDNAGSADQVRPLLPGTPACTVVVTSRDTLSGLVARDGAARLDLDMLPLEDAVALLRSLIGARADAEPAATRELASQCSRLPLALRVAAELAASRPAASLGELAGELTDLRTRLDLLTTGGDPRTQVRAVFSWSYQQLSADTARMFRLLGLHPGPDISIAAAASLTATGQPETRRLLGELARLYLIAEHTPGRYAFHDLLRAYAAGQARACDSESERREAIGRVLDHYLHSAAHGAFTVTSTFEPVALLLPRPGTVPERPPSPRSVLAWFDAEHQVLLAAVSLAAESGFDRHAWQLPWAMTPFLRKRGHWQEWTATQRTALAASTRLGDIPGQAVARRLLATAYDDLGDYAQALGYYLTSLELYRRLGDGCGEARTFAGLGVLAARQGRHRDALSYDEQSLRLYQAAGDKAGEAVTLYGIGWDHGLLGDYAQARAFCRQALTLNAEVGNRDVDAAIWDSLGHAEHQLGSFAEAAASYERALGIIREFGDRWRESVTLTHIGDTRHAVGDLRQAREAWREALVILEELDHPDAGKVRARLMAQTP